MAQAIQHKSGEFAVGLNKVDRVIMRKYPIFIPDLLIWERDASDHVRMAKEQEKRERQRREEMSKNFHAFMHTYMCLLMENSSSAVLFEEQIQDLRSSILKLPEHHPDPLSFDTFQAEFQEVKAVLQTIPYEQEETAMHD